MRLVIVLEILIGVIIITVVRGKDIHSSRDSAALILGYLLIFIGLSYLIWNEEIRFELDLNRRMIHWRKKNILKKKEKKIPFSEVKRIFIQRLGKASAFTEFYFVSVELTSGEIINTGDRFSSKLEAEERIDLLNRQLGLKD